MSILVDESIDLDILLNLRSLETSLSYHWRNISINTGYQYINALLVSAIHIRFFCKEFSNEKDQSEEICNRLL